METVKTKGRKLTNPLTHTNQSIKLKTIQLSTFARLYSQIIQPIFFIFNFFLLSLKFIFIFEYNFLELLLLFFYFTFSFFFFASSIFLSFSFHTIFKFLFSCYFFLVYRFRQFSLKKISPLHKHTLQRMRMKNLSLFAPISYVFCFLNLFSVNFDLHFFAFGCFFIRKFSFSLRIINQGMFNFSQIGCFTSKMFLQKTVGIFGAWGNFLCFLEAIVKRTTSPVA